MLAELADDSSTGISTFENYIGWKNMTHYVFSWFPEIRARWPFTWIPERYFNLFKKDAYVKDPANKSDTSTDPKDSWLLGGRDCSGVVNSEKFGGMCEQSNLMELKVTTIIWAQVIVAGIVFLTGIVGSFLP